jgi:hypothetical protein
VVCKQATIAPKIASLKRLRVRHCRAIAILITRAAWREKCLVWQQKTLDGCNRFKKQ